MGQVEDPPEGGAEDKGHNSTCRVEQADQCLGDSESLEISGEVDQEEEGHLLQQRGSEQLAEIGAEASGHSRCKVTGPWSASYSY